MSMSETEHESHGIHPADCPVESIGSEKRM